jgi:alpha-tubulin suppressor-like RCC1 family protein
LLGNTVKTTTTPIKLLLLFCNINSNSGLIWWKAIDVACGGFHTLILSDQGCVNAMGKEDFGLLGIGS